MCRPGKCLIPTVRYKDRRDRLLTQIQRHDLTKEIPCLACDNFSSVHSAQLRRLITLRESPPPVSIDHSLHICTIPHLLIDNSVTAPHPDHPPHNSHQFLSHSPSAEFLILDPYSSYRPVLPLCHHLKLPLRRRHPNQQYHGFQRQTVPNLPISSKMTKIAKEDKVTRSKHSQLVNSITITKGHYQTKNPMFRNYQHIE